MTQSAVSGGCSRPVELYRQQASRAPPTTQRKSRSRHIPQENLLSRERRCHVLFLSLSHGFETRWFMYTTFQTSFLYSFYEFPSFSEHGSCHFKHILHANRTHVQLSTCSSVKHIETPVIFMRVYEDGHSMRTFQSLGTPLPEFLPVLEVVLAFCPGPLPYCAAKSSTVALSILNNTSTFSWSWGSLRCS